jgi:hypothetical protein
MQTTFKPFYRYFNGEGKKYRIRKFEAYETSDPPHRAWKRKILIKNFK